MTPGTSGPAPLLLVCCLALGAVATPAAAQEEMDDAVFHYSRLAIDAGRDQGRTLSRWDAAGWIGTDIDRLWWSTEGDITDSDVEHAEVLLLYGQYVRRFWDVVVGYRHDVHPVSQGYFTVGIMGLAPYWFEVGLFGFISDHGRPGVRLSGENDLFITQRVVLSLEGQIDWLMMDDAQLDLAAGITEVELGVRTRYEIRRKFAPYLDVTWAQAADPMTVGPDPVDTDGLRIGIGLRLIY